jgi:plasmid stability protein
MCQMCEEYEAELRRMGIIEKIVVSDETLDQLKHDAKRHGRSVEEEAAERLSVPKRPSRAEMIDRLEQTAALLTLDVPQTDSTLLIRADRDR